MPFEKNEDSDQSAHAHLSGSSLGDAVFYSVPEKRGH